MDKAMIELLARRAGLDKALAEFPEDVAAAAEQASGSVGEDEGADRSARRTLAADAGREPAYERPALDDGGAKRREAIAARKLSPVELTQALLERIDRLDPKLQRLHPARRRRGDGRGQGRRGGDRRGPAARAAARRAGRHQGHHRCRRPADDLPFEDPDRQCRRGRCGLRRRACAAPARSCWASSRRTNSRSAARASICRGRRRATRGTPTIIPAARPRARGRASRPGCFRWRWAATPAAACAIRPAPAASSG